MAYIGLRRPIIGKLNIEKGTYSTPFTFGKAIAIQVTPSYAEGSLYADDVQAEYDKIFSYADVVLNTSTIPIQAHADMFGHTTADSPNKFVTFNADDENGYVGVAWITVEKVDGVRSFTANFLCKVKFSEPAEDYATKGESIEYKTPSINGRALALDDGKWKEIAVFDTEEAAKAWIDGKFTPSAPGE
ncbi:major tail protein [Ruminococcus gauvreauii]|uniref:major tail protein n=1 Tax=Ruminococcus gauvreauii TaxID=438033 RepID=UPI0039842EA7